MKKLIVGLAFSFCISLSVCIEVSTSAMAETLSAYSPQTSSDTNPKVSPQISPKTPPQIMPKMTARNGYVEPFKMFDNVYYVGDKWVSSYAVVTSSGLVLIDTLEFPFSQWIPVNLKKLGLADKSVTHLIVTHGHTDHVGGAAYLQNLYGADVIITEKGQKLAIAQAAKSKGESKFLPPNPKSFVQDSSSLMVGYTEFKFYITPGHTAGDLSVDFMVKDRGKEYRAFVVGGHSPNLQNASLAAAFKTSMARIKALAGQSPEVTVNLANHPHKNNLFKNRDRTSLQAGDDAAVNPFVDQADFYRFIQQQESLAVETEIKSN
ncbi:MBL fold metallo-hydrolase [Corallincola platygyrae]|uniref:MBL fold metallo-hydrolase n=1 Tax=Corallincola platygyrae TaxID=1193278 RepID=A0ABW4XJE9_9GAMM